MRAVLSWVDHLQDNDGTANSVYDVVFKPDGTELLVASGNVVSVYDPADGSVLHSLKGHKDDVYCVDYAHNGERYASGGADKSVIIWTSEHEGVLKFNHNEAVQCLAFCPVTTLLVSCAITDFGLWSLDSKSVTKHKVQSRICCCDWSRDGQYFALGLFNGTVSIRTKSCEERAKIERPEQSPVWCLAFNRLTEDASRQIAIGDWNQTISFYREDGQTFSLENESQLTFDPCGLDFFALGEYIVLGGSSQQVEIYTSDASKLGQLCQQESWIWTCRAKPRSNYVIVGCDDGTLACYQLVFSTVHGLHKDRYGFRDNMTDVVIQHLLQDRTTNIRCKDLVKKVAIYKNICAIQLTGKIVIYEMTPDSGDTGAMIYKSRDKIMQNLECSLLVVCACNIILCQERRLQCYDFKGLKQREWQMDALIRYIKVVGGPPGAEVLLIGLKSGQVLRTFLNNPFPALILQISSAVRCLDISAKRTTIAIVDDHNTCLVYDMKSKELLCQEPNANSVAWNTQAEKLLCYSGSGHLHTKAGDLSIYKQPLQGFVVGFSGSKVFCLHLYSMSAVEVPLSHQLYQYIARKDFQSAYQIACLGVPESDWLLLASQALVNLELETSKMAFIRSRNLRFLELINTIEERRRRGDSNIKSFLGEIKAYQGSLDEAATIFKDAGLEQKAIDMFTDLRMFEKAQQMLAGASGTFQKQLIRKRADWAANTNEPRLAAEMYIAAGDYQRALVLIFQHNFLDMLTQLVNKLDRTEGEVLKQCADYFTKMQKYDQAAEIYIKIDDMKSLIDMYVEAKMWDEAFDCAKDREQLLPDIYLPYANWLAENDRFEEAQKAFHKAGKIERALYVLEQLTINAVLENRFNDAAYYYWMLSLQYLERAKEDTVNQSSHLFKFRECQKLADLYYAYNAIHRYTAEPFTSHQAEALFNIARFLTNALGTSATPRGISKVSTLYTLAKQGQRLGLHKLARMAYDKLQTMRAPPRFQQVIELGALIARSKPFHDSDEMIPVCYRCSATNPMLSNQEGNQCIKCGHPFVLSHVSFETLPAIEFVIENGVSDQEAKDLIEAEPPLNEDAETATILKDAIGAGIAAQSASRSTGNGDPVMYTPVILPRSGLVSLHRAQVLICEWPEPLKYQYFLNLIPEISISKCDSCHRLFHTDDYEMKVLQDGSCPFCKRKSDRTIAPSEYIDDENDD